MNMYKWQIGDQVEIVSTSFDDSQRTFYGAVGKVVDVKASAQFGDVDLRLLFEDGYETWLPAEDCAKY